MVDIEDAILKVVVGVEKKSRIVTDKEKRLTSYHEGGHAIINKVLVSQGPVHQISIIPRGMAGGFTLSLPQEDKNYMSKNEMFEEIVSLLGGRVAEALCLDDISTGASNDIQRATAIAKKMVTKYGMSDRLGPIDFGGHDYNSGFGIHCQYGKLGFRICQTKSAFTTPITFNTWHVVTCTWNCGVMTLYLDGVKSTEFSYNGLIVYDPRITMFMQ